METVKSQDDLVMLALLAVGGFLLYKMLSGAGGAVASAGKAAISSAAQSYVNLTSGSATPTGSVILPNGAAVPLSQLAVTNIAGSNAAQFSYGGQNYYLTSGHDANGNYAASTDTPTLFDMGAQATQTDVFGNSLFDQPILANPAPLTTDTGAGTLFTG